MRPRWLVIAAITAGCARPAYERQEYALLPRINVFIEHHGDSALNRDVNEVRYMLVTSLAEQCVALADGPYDDRLPQFAVDIVAEGYSSGAEQVFETATSNAAPQLSRGPLAPGPMAAGELPLPIPSPSQTRYQAVEASVRLRRPRALETSLVGRVRGMLGANVASIAQLSDGIAALIRKGMANAPRSAM